jgi:hypothetical protein
MCQTKLVYENNRQNTDFDYKRCNNYHNKGIIWKSQQKSSRRID